MFYERFSKIGHWIFRDIFQDFFSCNVRNPAFALLCSVSILRSQLHIWRRYPPMYIKRVVKYRIWDWKHAKMADIICFFFPPIQTHQTWQKLINKIIRKNIYSHTSQLKRFKNQISTHKVLRKKKITLFFYQHYTFTRMNDINDFTT